MTPSRPPTTRRPRGRAARSGLARLCDLAAAVIVVAALGWAGANLAVTADGGRLFVVAGGSMEPALPPGSIVVVRPIQGSPAVGDAVTVRGEHGAYVTHRVTRVARVGGELHLELRGDANAAPDPVLAPARSVVGRVELVLPHLGRVQLALARPAGWLVVLGSVVTCWLAAGLLRPPPLAPMPLPEPRSREARSPAGHGA